MSTVNSGVEISTSLPESTGLIEDPPYRIVLQSRNYRFIRYFLLFYMIYTIIQMSRGILLFDQFSSLVYILFPLAILFSYDEYRILTWNNGYQLDTYRSWFFHLLYSSSRHDEINIELTVFSTNPDDVSKVVISDTSRKIAKFKVKNKHAKRLQEFANMLNISFMVKKRSKKGNTIHN